MTEPYENEPTRPRLIAPMLMAVALMVAVLAATYFFARGDDPTDVEVTAPDVAVTVPVDDATTPSDGDGAPADDQLEPSGDEDADRPGETDDAADRIIDYQEGAGADFDLGGGPDAIVHGPTGFGMLSWTPDGVVARRSTDGTEWSDTPTVGLPARAGLRGLEVGPDGYVAVFEQYAEIDYEEGAEPFFFEGTDAPTYTVASSPDLVEWTTTVLPAIDAQSEYGTSVHMIDFAISDDRLLAIIDVFAHPPSEMRLLYDAGLIGEADFESYCGLAWESFERGEPAAVFTCDFSAEEQLHLEFEERMDQAETDEEREAIEREFEERWAEPERTEIAVVQPGTELYAELSRIVLGDREPDIDTRVVTGPIAGPFSMTNLDLATRASAVVGTEDGFLAVLSDYEAQRSDVITSADGVEWSSPSPIGTNHPIWTVEAAGSLLVAGGGDEIGRAFASVSTDSGATWALTSWSGSLYGAWVAPVSGPAGIGVWLEGATEPYPEYPPLRLSLDKGGYILEVVFEEDMLLLTGPDGEVVHDVRGIEAMFEGAEIEGVFRRGSDGLVTFVDPATGDDLVSYTPEEFEVAFAASEEAIDHEFVEPPRIRQIWFTADGTSWIELNAPPLTENSWAQLAAVGDDEVLVSVTTWLEPPRDLWTFEEEGRDPTDAEIAALDAWFAENDGGSRIDWVRIPLS